jgi:hypothetical protein
VKLFVTACLFAGFIVLPAHADIIYFKDGMKTICEEKAWEEDGEIKCEYAGWVISYQKIDVLRILKTTPTNKTTPTTKKATANKSTPAIKQVQPKKKSASTQTTTKTSVTKKIKSSPDQPSDPVFYDPRRSYKYWAEKNSKHKSYKQAIQALAKKYNRTPEWIQSHMGDTNNLAQIHRNLANPQTKQTVTKSAYSANQSPEVIFYNPRRPYPYWTDKKTKHKSFKEAIQALAKKYDRAPEWVKLNMGATNDLNEIHGNLKERTATEP